MVCRAGLRFWQHSLLGLAVLALVAIWIPFLARIDSTSAAERHAAGTPCRSPAPATAHQKDIAELRSKLEAAQARMTDFNQQHPEVAALHKLEQQLRVAQGARRAIEGADPGRLPASVQALRNKLATEQEVLAQLYTVAPGPRHPEVLRARAQVEATQQSLDAATGLAHAREIEADARAAVDAQRARLAGDRALMEAADALRTELQAAQLTYRKAFDRPCSVP
jgi:hypothetical protein